MSNLEEIINLFLKQQESCIQKIFGQTNVVTKIVDTLIHARDNGNKILIMGNGGSGSTASHFVSDLLKTAITKDNKRFLAISLVDNIPVLLAWANDISFEDIFVEQLRNFLSNGDIIIGFSGSGKSKNIVKAMQYGKTVGATCIGITGMSGGEFPTMCDICLIVPSNDMLIVESSHVILCHCIVTAIRGMGDPLFKYE